LSKKRQEYASTKVTLLRGQVKMRIRLRVKEIATEKKVSMTRLHIRSEVAYTTIRKVFRDPYTDITLTTLSKLAQALNVSTKDLIEDVPEE
jgi:DNA-binding Xre family transcriptional regulator